MIVIETLRMLLIKYNSCSVHALIMLRNRLLTSRCPFRESVYFGGSSTVNEHKKLKIAIFLFSLFPSNYV